MDAFFQPKSVAIIGASAKEGKIGYEILKNVLKSNANVFPINPNRKEIDGIKCYKSVLDIEENIELAIIAIPPEYVLDAMEECGKKGIKHVIVISGGFREVGNDAIERKMADIAREYGIRIIGPNCIGVFNAKNGFNTFFQRHMMLPHHGNVAILTQSGTFGIGLLEKLAQEKIGVSKFVSYGNKSDVNEVDLIEYLENDKETKIIAIYAEDFSQKFFERKYKKPIIVLKGGRSETGKKAASLHTGAMATSYEIFQGVCKQLGIIVVDNFAELFSIIKIMSMQKLPKNGKIAIITNGAGPAVIAADLIDEKDNLELVELIDLTGSATADDYLKALENLDDDIGIVALIFVFHDAPLVATLQKFYDGFRGKNALYVAIAIGGDFVMEQKEKLSKLSIPLFDEPSILINALDKVVWFKNESSCN
ncbi:MAG: hypothetical protein DRG80_07485 [Deltaproteobacteria bacterium]|nr:MAG: hypothetical protein DRG80_07485 [Deltaproteobacteria bacterium]